MKKLFITLLTTTIVTTALLSHNPTVTAKDKLSTYDLEVQETINTCYTNMSMSQREYFNKQGYHIIILKENQKIHDINSDYAEFSTGLIDYKDNMIYIQYFHDTELMKMNLYHELGHMLDESNNFISNTSDFNFIWNEREDFFSHFSYPTEYFKKSRRETFAQMYSVYKQYPNWMCENYGYIYNYFLVLETEKGL